jgi:hypothetical protein
MDPVALKVLDRVPLPTDPTTGRLSALEPQPVTGDTVVGKFDFHPRAQDRVGGLTGIKGMFHCWTK